MSAAAAASRATFFESAEKELNPLPLLADDWASLVHVGIRVVALLAPHDRRRAEVLHNCPKRALRGGLATHNVKKRHFLEKGASSSSSAADLAGNLVVLDVVHSWF